jgi:hypothetical protein
VPIPILDTKQPFSTIVYNIISAKLVPEINLFTEVTIRYFVQRGVNLLGILDLITDASQSTLLLTDRR